MEIQEQLREQELTGVAAQIFEDSKRTKTMSAKQAERLQTIGLQERATKAANKGFVEDFNKLPFLNVSIITEVLRRIGTESADRNALKVLWCLRHGWKITEPHDLVFFGELTDEEAAMTETQFTAHLEKFVPSNPVSLSKAKRVEVAIMPAVRLCKSGKLCMRYEKRKAAPAKGNGQYCSPACSASDRARQKRALAGIATSIQ